MPKQSPAKNGSQNRYVPASGEAEKTNPWQEHPIAIAAMSVCATSVFFVTVIMPIWNKKELNKVEELEARLAPFEKDADAARRSLQAQLEDAKKDRDSFKEELVALKIEVEKLRRQNMFNENNPYPAGHRFIKIGDPIQKIRESYKKSIDEDLEDWISVATEANSFFSSITFYKTDDGKKVSHILFSIRSDIRDEFQAEVLKAKVIALAGEPRFVSKVNGRAVEYCWKGVKGVNLAIPMSSGYVIYGLDSHSPRCGRAIFGN